MVKFIDAHHHLWDIEKHHYPWLAAKGEVRFFGQPDAIRKNYLVTDFSQDHQHRIAKSVHIQVGISPELRLQETQWLQQCSQQTQGLFPAKAVVEIDMLSDDIEQQIVAQKCHSITQGVRHIIGKSPEENKTLPKFSQQKWLYAFQLLAKYDLSFDLQLTEEFYEDVYTTLLQVPELKVAICHLASPWVQSNAGFDNWVKYMRCFASLPNCYMKISGFSMFNHKFEPSRFFQYAHKAIDIFSSKRCMLGSNFPVDKLYIDYQELLQHWQTLIGNYPTEQQLDIASKTAESFYCLSQN